MHHQWLPGMMHHESSWVCTCKITTNIQNTSFKLYSTHNFRLWEDIVPTKQLNWKGTYPLFSGLTCHGTFRYLEVWGDIIAIHKHLSFTSASLPWHEDGQNHHGHEWSWGGSCCRQDVHLSYGREKPWHRLKCLSDHSPCDAKMSGSEENHYLFCSHLCACHTTFDYSQDFRAFLHQGFGLVAQILNIF